MKVILIDPGATRTEINEPIGLGMIAAAAIERLGSNVTISQYFDPINGLPSTEEILLSDIVGISAPLGSLSKIHNILDKLKNKKTKTPVIILGGVIATFASEELLNTFPEAIIVIGEGEEAFSLLCEYFHRNSDNNWRNNLSTHNIPNLKFNTTSGNYSSPRKNINLQNYPTPQRPFLKELITSGSIIRIESSRGCSYGKCSFCAIQYKYCNQIEWRTAKTDKIIEQLSEITHAGALHPYFTDEDFIGNTPERTIEIADAIINAKNKGIIDKNLSLYIDIRASDVFRRTTSKHPSGIDSLRKLKLAGLREVFIGIESGTASQVKRYKKPSTAKRNLIALNTLRELHIDTDIGFIFFDPLMSIEDAKENLQFIKSANLWNHDSRLTKEIRLEAKTPLVKTYTDLGLINGKLNIDQLTYNYKWKDSKIEEIHSLFREWESSEQGIIYDIQSKTRGEVKNENLRKIRRNALGQIRGSELDALHSMITFIEHKNNIDTFNLDPFTEKRQALIENAKSVCS